MITVGICDKNRHQRQKIRKYCDRYFRKHTLFHQCIEFGSGEEVLNFQKCEIQLLFMDTELRGISGLTVLDNLTGSSIVKHVVFVSDDREKRYQVIELKTLAFFDKPISNRAVEKCLSVVMREKGLMVV